MKKGKIDKYKIDYQNYDFILKEALEIFRDKTLNFLGVNFPKITMSVKT